MTSQHVLVIGANSTIAQSITDYHLKNGDTVFAVSRQLQTHPTPPNENLHWHIS